MFKIKRFLKIEWTLGLLLVTVIIFQLCAEKWFQFLDNPLVLSVVSISLLSVILLSAVRATNQAEAIGAKIGEPFSTLVLTLSVVFIEVGLIVIFMLTGKSNPTMARDTMFAVLMIVLNGLLGMALVLGALKHKEQSYNLKGVHAYFSVIMVVAVLGLILPNVTSSTEVGTLSHFQSYFLVGVSLSLFFAFLFVQTLAYRSYFISDSAHNSHHSADFSLPVHIGLLIFYLLGVVFLAKKLSIPVDHAFVAFGLPEAFAGFVIALIILTPEALGALRSAVANQLQKSLNIFLGSVLATITLTLAAVIIISNLNSLDLVLGLSGSELVLLLLTLLVSINTFISGQTSLLNGLIHLILFFAYVMLIFEP